MSDELMHEPDAAQVILPPGFLKNPVHLLAFGFGSGAAPRAPGTWGSFAAIPLWYAFSWMPPLAYWFVVLAAFLVGIWLCGKTATDLKVHDHGGIVWDEFVGMWITLFLKKRRILDYKMFEQSGLNRNSVYQMISGMQEIKLQGCEQRKRWEWEDIQADLFNVNLDLLSNRQNEQVGSVFIN